jgi:putative PIN family toxin of toxin-antitoxin system
VTKAPRLVLDTNVVVSALLWHGRPGQLLAMAAQGEIRLYTSRLLLAELQSTLERPKLVRRAEYTGLAVANMISNYRNAVTLARPALLERAYSRDPDDDHVIACALAAKADAIVSGDDDLLSMKTASGIAIRTVAETLKWLDALGLKATP